MLKTVPQDEFRAAGCDTQSVRPAVRFTILLCLGLWFILGTLLLCTGPFLNSHEVIVAQIARQTVQNGNWVVPRYLDVPFLVKPPLTPWLAAVAGSLLPADALTGLPVSTFAARLPSLIATLMTIVVLYALARSMYGRRIGLCAAFIYATSAGVLVYALNATSEALLVFFSTWAYAEFWWSRQATGREKTCRQLRFYVAFGLAMMTKAPMPLMVVGVPLAAWWWAERSTRLLAQCGPGATSAATKLFGRDVLRRLRLALKDLGLWWGVPLALVGLFVWMWAVSRQVDYIWSLWHVEYLDRMSDESLWPASHGWWYYLPVLFGFAAPWLLSLPEALASPFLKQYREHLRPNVYVWYWVVISTLLLSVMHFKQDYYLLPVLPGCALLLSPVLYRLFFGPSLRPSRVTVRMVYALMISVPIAGPIAGFLIFGDELAGGRATYVMVLVGLIVLVLGAGVMFAASSFLQGAKPRAFWTVGLTGVAVFALAWVGAGLHPGQLRDQAALIEGLTQAGIGKNENVYWGSSVPDGRITFYGNRWVRQIGDPFQLRADVEEMDGQSLLLSMGAKVCKMLEHNPDYFVFERERYALLTTMFRPPSTVLFEVDRLPVGRDENDWLVITNKQVDLPK